MILLPNEAFRFAILSNEHAILPHFLGGRLLFFLGIPVLFFHFGFFGDFVGSSRKVQNLSRRGVRDLPES